MNILDQIAKDMLERHSGRISTFPANWVYDPTEAQIKRTIDRNPHAYHTRVDKDGCTVHMIHQRAMLCPNPPEGKYYETKGLFWLAHYKCRKCEYHQKGKRRGTPRYPCCKFKASKNPRYEAAKETLDIFSEAVNRAEEILRV